MKKFTTYLGNLTTAVGFSEDKITDDPGNGSGTGAVAQTVNDLAYAIISFAKKYIGGITDTDESDDNSDLVNSIESMVGIQNALLLEWSNVTVYAEDAEVMYLGVQFVSMFNSNSGNNPIDTISTQWMPVPSDNPGANLLWQFANGKIQDSGVADVHNYRSVNYRQLFKNGTFTYGGFDGSGGAGRTFSFTCLHLDGTVVTGDTPLENLLDVGGANEYKFLDIFAPDVVGTRTLLDAKGAFRRYVDAIAGNTEDVGGAGAENLPNIEGNLGLSSSSDSVIRSFDSSDLGGAFSSTPSGTSNQIATLGPGGSSKSSQAIFDASTYNSKYSSKDAVEPLSIVDGIPYIVIMTEIV